MVVAQRPVGVHGDLSAQEIGGVALELEHVEQVAIVGDMAAEPPGGGERQVRDPMPDGQVGQFGGTGTDLLLGGRREVRGFG